MPRSARLDAPGVLHHIMIRGIERRTIFRIKKDREDFLERLSHLLPETETSCYAWTLMSNHAHFLFRTGRVPLATLMRRLLTGYAVSFNRRHERHGQLFQNRYKSIVCQEDPYFKELVRYIHLNPVRVGIVNDLTQLNQYGYSGHSAVMGKKERPWQDISYVLGFFGDTIETARRSYASFMEAGFEQGHREELTGGGFIRSLGGWKEITKRDSKGLVHAKSDERILGDSSFVTEVLSHAGEQLERKDELKRLGLDLNGLAARVSELFEIEADEFLSSGKQKSKVKARSVFCYWAVTELGVSLSELARRIGISVPAVGYSVERGRALCRERGFRLIEEET